MVVDPYDYEETLGSLRLVSFVIVLVVIGCRDGEFGGSTNKRKRSDVRLNEGAEVSSSEQTSSDDSVDEPVPVAGAYLVQEVATTEKKDGFIAVGARVQNSLGHKIISINVEDVIFGEAATQIKAERIAQPRESRFHIVYYVPADGVTENTTIKITLGDLLGGHRDMTTALKGIVTTPLNGVNAPATGAAGAATGSVPNPNPSVTAAPKTLTFVAKFTDGAAPESNFLDKGSFCDDGGKVRSKVSDWYASTITLKTTQIQGGLALPYAKRASACFKKFKTSSFGERHSFTSGNDCWIFIVQETGATPSMQVFIARKADAPTEEELNTLIDGNRCPTTGLFKDD